MKKVIVIHRAFVWEYRDEINEAVQEIFDDIGDEYINDEVVIVIESHREKEKGVSE